MSTLFRRVAVGVVLSWWLVAALSAQSVFRHRPDDPLAVDFTAALGAPADGVTDCAAALQAAIDRVEATTHAGIVWVPEGRYRISKTVYVWQGIRLIGYGSKRPVFVLGRNTPGFQEGTGKYVFHFADNRPKAGEPFVDASEFTFYSGMSNIDIELEDGNPTATAIRFHVAQHSALTHMNIRVGAAHAGLEDIGNQASDLVISGGDYGIVTKRTAPVWQFLLMDSRLEGQRVAAIQTQEAGFTLVRVRISDVPVALEIPAGQVEQLYGRDLQLERIAKAALVGGNTANPHSEITLENVACSAVPRFYGGATAVSAPGAQFVVDRFSLGLELGDDGRERGIAFYHSERAVTSLPAAPATDIPELPPVDEWFNVHELGAKGDGTTDDTPMLRAAIAGHRCLYFPTGNYRVTGPLELKPDTVLIGLNPGTTQIVLADGAEAYGGKGAPVGVISAPRGGRNQIVGLGVATGVNNPRAIGIVWRAGAKSLLDDVSFPGRARVGRPPTFVPPAPGAAPSALPPAPPTTRVVDLLVTDNGGGIFRGNWLHAPDAKAGLRIENTSTPSRIYQMSVEHHHDVEAQFERVRNWEVFALQTEEENPAGARAYALDVQDCADLTFANSYMYRVSRNVLPKAAAVQIRRSDAVRFAHVKVFSQTRLAFDNAVIDEDTGANLRSHFFTEWVKRRHPPGAAAAPGRTDSGKPAAPALPTVVATGLEKLAAGFSNASGLAVSDSGEVFFTDAVTRAVYRWDAAAHRAEKWAEVPGQPMALAFVPPDHLLAVALDKSVYALRTTERAAPERVSETAEPLPNTTLLLPVGMHNELSVLQDLLQHRGYVYRRGSNTAIVRLIPDEPRAWFYAPGTGTGFLGGGTWRPNLQASQFAAVRRAEPCYLTSEDDGRTYLATWDGARGLSTTVFAERGGTSVIADAAGNVYLASGNVWIYDRAGKLIGCLEVPERPSSLALAGPDRRTLFIAARSSLYSVRLR